MTKEHFDEALKAFSEKGEKLDKILDIGITVIRELSDPAFYRIGTNKKVTCEQLEKGIYISNLGCDRYIPYENIMGFIAFK